MKHLLLFESHTVYQKSLNDEYWKDIGKKFPDYNSSNSPDCSKAVDYIYNEMKKKYPNENWDVISKEIKSNIKRN